jgi:hypothetical protein
MEGIEPSKILFIININKVCGEININYELSHPRIILESSLELKVVRVITSTISTQPFTTNVTFSTVYVFWFGFCS